MNSEIMFAEMSLLDIYAKGMKAHVYVKIFTRVQCSVFRSHKNW